MNIVKLKYTRVQENLLILYLGTLAVIITCSSGVKVPGSKSCHCNGLVKYEENLR